MADFHERTDAEREAARLERERRRAESRGVEKPFAPFDGRSQAGSERAEPPAVTPSPLQSPPAQSSPPPAAPPPSNAGPPPADPPGDEDLLSPYDTGELELPAPADEESAVGTRRVGWREARGAKQTASPKPPRRPPREPRRHRFGAPHSRTGRVAALLALVLAAAVIWFVVELFQPFHGSGNGDVTVKIPAHASTSQIGDQLDRQGVISCTFPSCSFLFRLRVSLSGKKLLPGTYHLKQDMSYGDVIKVLSTPPPPVPTTGVTITPGKTRQEINQLLHSQGVKGSYVAASRHSHVLNPRSYGAPAGTNSLEGFLFPDTYQLRVPVNVDTLVNDQLARFKKAWAGVNLGYARSHGMSPYQVLIVASMVEKEAETQKDRPLIASVIYNRLRQDMLLQIDATVRYAVNNYTSPITESQLHAPSPFNTYVHKGLPPTPIANPGLDAIQAAAHPANTNYLFFVVKPCGNGEHAFASTYSQFLQEEQQYNAARSQRGGHSPARC
jgi:uncharacterized YceG family protein